MDFFIRFLTDRSLSIIQVFGLLAFSTSITAVTVWIVLRNRWNRLFRKRSHSVVTGLINEQFAPILKGFPGEAADARFIGKPIDYIVFKGLSRGRVEELLFVEVKSHPGIGLTANERAVKEAVQNHRVRWEQYYPQ